MITKNASPIGLQGFPCMKQPYPLRERNVLLLVSDLTLRHVLKDILLEQNCLVTEGVDSVDFIVMDPFFLDDELLHLVDCEIPMAPILLVVRKRFPKKLVQVFEERLYDIIHISENTEVAREKMENWFEQPKAKCLTRGCHLAFGTGRWVCHSRAMCFRVARSENFEWRVSDKKPG
jgi:hypothetical protein